MARKKGWTCQRVAASKKCGHLNPPRKRKCEACGKTRPARKQPAHMVALELDYEDYIALNGGEHCGVCRRGRSARRRLDRDHDHKSGEPRGLLCPRCNRGLPSWMTSDWLRKAADYLDRAAARLHTSK